MTVMGVMLPKALYSSTYTIYHTPSGRRYYYQLYLHIPLLDSLKPAHLNKLITLNSSVKQSLHE